MLDGLLLLIGLAILLGGAEVLVRGISSLAKGLGVPPVAVALTVVAFGTSTPELVVGIMAARSGDTGVVFGNIVGASTVNIGLVVALTAIVRPIVVEHSIITREIPMMLLAIAAMMVLSLDGWFDATGAGQQNLLQRGDGVMLLLLFCVFIYYTIMDALRRRSSDPFLAELRQVSDPQPRQPLWRAGLLILAGLVAVSVGGRMSVGAAVRLAESIGIGQHIIALTIISWGTTLPELATSIVAARRGQSEIAIGNVVGSVIYNILCVGGVVAVLHPVAVPPGGAVDLLFMAAMAAALLPVSIIGPGNISRGEGILLLIAYLVYMLIRLAAAAA
jgi:cation:H+ antiporter